MPILIAIDAVPWLPVAPAIRDAATGGSTCRRIRRYARHVRRGLVVPCSLHMLLPRRHRLPHRCCTAAALKLCHGFTLLVRYLWRLTFHHAALPPSLRIRAFPAPACDARTAAFRERLFLPLHTRCATTPHALRPRRCVRRQYRFFWFAGEQLPFPAFSVTMTNIHRQTVGGGTVRRDNNLPCRLTATDVYTPVSPYASIIP